MVMGGDSCFKGRGLESQHHILDGHFSHIFVVNICNVCLKRPKINEKEAGDGPFKKTDLPPLPSSSSLRLPSKKFIFCLPCKMF